MPDPGDYVHTANFHGYLSDKGYDTSFLDCLDVIKLIINLSDK